IATSTSRSPSSGRPVTRRSAGIVAAHNELTPGSSQGAGRPPDSRRYAAAVVDGRAPLAPPAARVPGPPLRAATSAPTAPLPPPSGPPRRWVPGPVRPAAAALLRRPPLDDPHRLAVRAGPGRPPPAADRRRHRRPLRPARLADRQPHPARAHRPVRLADRR